MTKGNEKEVWRLEPEGEAEKSEATAPWSGVKGVSVNPEGESCRGQVRAKMAKERKVKTGKHLVTRVRRFNVRKEK